MSERSLDGARILVVEDESLIALGAVVVGPSSTVASALVLVGTPDLKAAILDVRLDGETVFPVAAALCARSIPFVFHTGDVERRNLLTEDWPGSEVLLKPAGRAMIVAALAKLLREN